MILRIANVNIKFTLHYQDLLAKRYVSYFSKEDSFDGEIVSCFVQEIIPYDGLVIDYTKKVAEYDISSTEKVVVNIHNGSIIHQMKFDLSGKRVTIDSKLSDDPIKGAELEHFKCGLALAILLFFRKYVMLHGSCIAYQDQGIIFSADSGVGKSTQSRLWMEYFGSCVTQINDDKPILGLQGAQVFAYGTPFSGKHHINENRSVPLKAIVFLKRSVTNSIKSLTVTEIIPKLFNQLTRFEVDTYVMSDFIGVVEQIISIVPCYELSCNMEYEAVKITYEMIFGGYI
ncbi:MAG TPA: hypothetical protein PLR26_02435 [Bacilli bacterium]|nr:hypothetical protein [Bacilli bacterium]